MDRPSAFLEQIEEKGVAFEELVYARTLNPASLADAWARYDRADFLLGLAWHFGAPLDRRTVARFAIECADRALLVFSPLERANLGPYEPLVNAMHRWLAGGDLGRREVTEADFAELTQLCEEHSRGPMPALTSVVSAYMAARASLDDVAAEPAVGPLACTALARFTATYASHAARDMVAEQRWQLSRLRELITREEIRSNGRASVGDGGPTRLGCGAPSTPASCRYSETIAGNSRRPYGRRPPAGTNPGGYNPFG